MGYFYKFRMGMSSITNPHHWLDYLNSFSEQEKPVETGTVTLPSHKCIAEFCHSCQVHRPALQKHPLLSRSNSITKSSERQRSLLMVDPILFSLINWCRRCSPDQDMNNKQACWFPQWHEVLFQWPSTHVYWGAARPQKPEQFQMLSQT